MTVAYITQPLAFKNVEISLTTYVYAITKQFLKPYIYIPNVTSWSTSKDDISDNISNMSSDIPICWTNSWAKLVVKQAKWMVGQISHSQSNEWCNPVLHSDYRDGWPSQGFQTDMSWFHILSIAQVAPFINMVLTLITAWLCNQMHIKLWDEFTYPERM